MERETSQVLAKVFASLRESGITRADVAREMSIHLSDLDEIIFGLVLTSIDGDGEASSVTNQIEQPKLRLV